MRWHGTVAWSPCPYCGTGHFVTPDEDMYNEAVEAGEDIELNISFNIVVPQWISSKQAGKSRTYMWDKLAPGHVFVMICESCGRKYVIHMYQRNADKTQRYFDNVQFYPQMQKPNEAFTFKSSTISEFLKSAMKIPNQFVKEKMLREFAARGIRLQIVQTK